MPEVPESLLGKSKREPPERESKNTARKRKNRGGTGKSFSWPGMKEAGRQEEGVRRQRKMEEKEGSRNSKDDNCRTAGKAGKL